MNSYCKLEKCLSLYYSYFTFKVKSSINSTLHFLKRYVDAPRASLVAQMVKNPPAMQETQFQSLGPKDPLEEGMATHSSILA